MEKLLESGSDASLQSNEELDDDCKITPLVAAFDRVTESKGCETPGSLRKVVELLENNGAALDAECKGWDVRTCVIREGVETLAFHAKLEQGVSLGVSCCAEPALAAALENGDLEAIQSLLDGRVNVKGKEERSCPWGS